jgi:hypothetical protein
MIIRGRFVGDAPYFAAHVRVGQFEGVVWLLADTGASRTTLLDRDVSRLGIPPAALEPASLPMIGVGGSVRSFVLRDVKLTFVSDEGETVLQQDVWVAQHDLDRLPAEEVARILRIPSVMGRDLINRFRLICDYRSGTMQLERQ